MDTGHPPRPAATGPDAVPEPEWASGACDLGGRAAPSRDRSGGGPPRGGGTPAPRPAHAPAQDAGPQDVRRHHERRDPKRWRPQHGRGRDQPRDRHHFHGADVRPGHLRRFRTAFRPLPRRRWRGTRPARFGTFRRVGFRRTPGFPRAGLCDECAGHLRFTCWGRDCPRRSNGRGGGRVREHGIGDWCCAARPVGPARHRVSAGLDGAWSWRPPSRAHGGRPRVPFIEGPSRGTR